MVDPVSSALQRLLQATRGRVDAHTLAVAERLAASELGQQHPSSQDEPLPRLEPSLLALHEQLMQGGDEEDRLLAENLLRVLQPLQGRRHRSSRTLTVSPKRHAASTYLNQPLADEELAFYLERLSEEESRLLREAWSAAGGLNGERLRFDKQHHLRLQSPALDAPRLSASHLGSGARDALRLIGEFGWLYRTCQQNVELLQSTGTVARGLCQAVDEELQAYRRMIAKQEASQPRHIRDVLLQLRPALPRLTTLAAVIDGLEALSGSQILTRLYQHTRHGDGRHVDLVERLHAAAARPWQALLQQWTAEGILTDPRHEFFVEERAVEDRLLWQEAFSMDQSKVPEGILDRDLVRPVFLLGKGINYIRRCLGQGDWSLQDPDEMDTEAITTCTTLTRSTSLAIRRHIESTSRQVHSHILQALRTKHVMMEHLFALKQFLLLGQGDFYAALMDGLHAAYGGHVGIIGIYRHNLVSIVESALRSTASDSFPAYILDRLHVELLLDSNDDARFTFAESKDSTVEEDTRTVWDVFTLDYTLPDPLVAIVPASTMAGYKKMFTFLFALRRVEYLLNLTWRQSAALQHALHTSAQYNAIKVQTSPAYSAAVILLRQIAMTRQAMMHFVNNLKSFLMFEVLEGGWKNLVGEIDAAETLDEVIEAHERYLQGILRKSLLENVSDKLGEQVEELLGLANDFCTYQQELFGEALEAVDRTTEKRRQAEQRLKQGDWGFHSETEVSEEETFFGLSDETKLEELSRLSLSFHDSVIELLKALDLRLNGGPISPLLDASSPLPAVMVGDELDGVVDHDDNDSLRFLAFQLDHNNYYGVNEAT